MTSKLTKQFTANLLGLIQMISLGSPTYMYMTSQKESQVHTAVKIYKQGLIEPHFDYRLRRKCRPGQILIAWP